MDAVLTDTLHDSSLSLLPQCVSTSSREATEPAVAAEKYDDLAELDFNNMRSRYADELALNALLNRCIPDSALTASIRQKDEKEQEAEHIQLHGSPSNVYEKTFREQEGRRTPSTGSEESLTSTNSEASCY
ncbi:unnamed protein product [Rotaria sordida]|uniref:Uncharacterized protein n=1 Tax=Rotaria sordida TaxID=392033 RepID=A0A815R6C5_9BILA|nr:unnamed protein product [Rotaria sordida]